MGEFALNGWIEIPFAEQGRLLPLLEEHVRLTRSEPGCLAFDITKGREDPSRFEAADGSETGPPLRSTSAAPAASAWGEATRELKRNYQIEGE